MDLIKILAESYGNDSKGNDFLSTSDGSEVWQNTIDTYSPSNNDLGAGYVRDTAKSVLEHPNSWEGENPRLTENTFVGKDKRDSEDPNNPDVNDSKRYTTMPYSEQGVDDNHANNGMNMGFTANLLTIMRVKETARKARQGQEADFMTSHTNGGAADSPQIMNDGHSDEELQRGQEGVEKSVNSFDPRTKGDTSMFGNPNNFNNSQMETDNSGKETPNIYKGRTFAHLTSYPFMVNHIPFKKKAIDIDVPLVPQTEEKEPKESGHLFDMLQPAKHGKNIPPAFERFEEKPMADMSLFSKNNLNQKATGEWQSAYQATNEYALPTDESNVPQIMDPDEVEFKRQKVRKDFGQGDYGSQNNMGNAPLQSDESSGSDNFSGMNPTAFLLNIFKKEAYWPAGEMPDQNSNSGQDPFAGLAQPERPMTDGKDSYVYDNRADKEGDTTLSDGANQNRKRKYNRTEDSDKQDYFGFEGTGGGFGGEGDGTFSGVNNA